MSFRLHLKIAIRFSYLGTSGFKISGLPTDALQAKLYDPDRLTRRFALFETLTLPSLKAQSHAAFSTAVLVGDSFPQEARRYLEGLLADVPGAHLMSLPPMGNYQAMQEVFRRLPTPADASHVATIRLDDDDAIHRDALRRIQEIATGMAALRDVSNPLVIGFNRGFFLGVGNSALELTEVHEKTPLGIGLALITPKHSPLNIYRRNHRLLPQFFDCYTDVSQPMFIRSVHRDNDSEAFASGQVSSVAQEDIHDVLRSGFDLTPAQLDMLGR